MEQTIPGPDGIGDTAYIIDENNQDMYPLTNQSGSVLHVYDIRKVLVSENRTNATKSHSVAIFTNSRVDFNFSSSGTVGSISFNVSGQYTYCNVIVAQELLGSITGVKVDGNPVPSFLHGDDYCLSVNFNCTVGTQHNVEILGDIARRCDVNCDGKVNILDISTVAREFGCTYEYKFP
jgi:hypothetical protein